eukprot:5982281-Amphidinium_carterae.1
MRTACHPAFRSDLIERISKQNQSDETTFVFMGGEGVFELVCLGVWGLIAEAHSVPQKSCCSVLLRSLMPLTAISACVVVQKASHFACPECS